MYLCPVDDLMVVADTLRADFEKLRNKSILLTGATGFIGKNLLESIIWINKNNNLNIQIYSLSRNPQLFFSSYPHFLKHSEFHLFKADIRDDLSVLSIPKIDLTIHAATDVVAQNPPTDIFNACLDGTLNTLSLSKNLGCQKFLLLSSGAIYGRLPSGMNDFEESYIGGVDLRSPKSAYALGKQLSEWLVHQASDRSMSVKVARCFAFVGPYLPLDQHFAIGNFIENSVRGRNIEIKGDGTPLRTYLYTADLCIWLLKILLNADNGSVFNVGGDDIISIGDLAHLVKETIKPQIDVNIHQVPHGDPDRYIPNINKISRELYLRPTISIREAIIKTANWNMKYEDIQ